MKRILTVACLLTALASAALCGLIWKILICLHITGAVSLLLPVAAAIVPAAPAAALVSRLVGKRFSASLSKLSGRLGNIGTHTPMPVETRPPYDEFTIDFLNVDAQIDAVSGRMTALLNERGRIDSILNSMSEGLVVLGVNLDVLTLNRSAASFFNAGPDIRGRNLLRLTRIPKILDAAKRVSAGGKRESFDVAELVEGKTLQFFVSSVREGGLYYTGGGVILLITDVTAVRRTEQIRSEFVANASHELRSPLTAIKGFAELIETGIIRDPKKVKKYLALMRGETERMIALIGDILELSTLESSGPDTGGTPVSLFLLAQRAAQSMEITARKKQVSVSVHGDEGLLKANPGRMTQLVLNLLDNAVKYNREGGKVDIGILTDGGGVKLTVADTGIGIPKEAQARVFERFYRVDKGRGRKQGGTGLGLSIVKHIVGLYKGAITLESEPGKGTAVTVFLPANPDSEK